VEELTGSPAVLLGLLRWMGGDDVNLVGDAYVAGDVAAVRALLPTANVNNRVALLVALGRYGEALSHARDKAPAALDVSQVADAAVALLRVNVGEALAELGRFDEARAVFDAPVPDWPLVEAARTTAQAWLSTTTGSHDAGLALVDSVDAGQLGPQYAAEPPLTRALCLLNAGRWGEARAALDEARRLCVRASTERNLLLHEARWALETGALHAARDAWASVQAHRWTGQGGAGLLSLGDAFAAHGCVDEARLAWRLCVSQDGESWAARAAKAR
jgi:tetratricopeptide (TPR) repeat protein